MVITYMGAKPGRKPRRNANSSNDSYAQNNVVSKRPAPNRLTGANIKFEPRTPKQAELAKNVEDFDYGAVIGPAGSGKSTVLIAKAVEMLLNKKVEKIVITRPIVEAFESIGHLPGTMEEKTSVYMVPLRDALNKFLGKIVVDNLFETQQIEIVPFAFMRGRSLEDCVIICDESQNCTLSALKMLCSRVGKNSKLYLNGDLDQIDIPKHASGFSDLLNAVEDANLPDFFITEFSFEDIQRHPMVAKMLKAISNYEKKKTSKFTTLEVSKVVNNNLISDPRLPESKPKISHKKKNIE